MYNVDKPEAERKFRRANPVEIPKDILKSILEETTSSKLNKILKRAIKKKTRHNNNEYIVSSLFKYLKTDSKKYIELIRDYTGISYKEAEAEYMSSEYIETLKKIDVDFKEKIEKEFLALSKKTEEEIFQFSLEKINIIEKDLKEINNAKSRYLKHLSYYIKLNLEEEIKKSKNIDDDLNKKEDNSLFGKEAVNNMLEGFIPVLYRLKDKYKIDPKHFLFLDFLNQKTVMILATNVSMIEVLMVLLPVIIVIFGLSYFLM